MATYTYSLSADFGNQICLRTLTNEINAESAIVATLSYITVAPITNEDDVDIVFTTSLSASEETALDNVVASHDGSICPEPASFTGFTVPVSGVSPTDGSHIATKSYTDSASANALTQAKMYADTISGGNINIYDDSVLEGSFEDINFINADAEAGWYDSNWLYRKRIAIDYTKVDGDLVNFPVLIYLNADSDLASKALSNGNDILFTSVNGFTKLDYERMSYSAGTLYAWVRIPLLKSAESTIIYMYYGNSGASDQQSAESAWGSRHKAVWHFENSFLDSTSNNNDGTNNGTTDVAGKVNRGREFNGSNQWINCGSGNIIFSGNTPHTLSGWINLDTKPGTYPQIFGARSLTNFIGYFVELYGGGSLVSYSLGNSSTWFRASFPYADINTGTWYHIAATYDGSNARIYLNGVLKNTVTGVTFTQPTLSFQIGRNQTDSHYFDGKIDEVRVSDCARSINWIKTEYNNQNSPGTFYSVGSEFTEQDIASVEISDPIYGYKFKDEESSGISSTSSSTWQSKQILDAIDLPIGRYRIEWYAGIQQSGSTFFSPDVEARVLINNVQVAYAIIEPQDAGNWYPFNGFSYLTITNPCRLNVNLQWRNVGTAGTGSIRNARISVWRIN